MATATVSSPRRLDFGTVPRKDEAKTGIEEVCSTYLRTKRADKNVPLDDETEAEHAKAKVILLARLRASFRKRIYAVGCMFHLHTDGVRDGISVDRRLKRYAASVPAVRRAIPTGAA